MKRLDLELEELEQRIAPDCTTVLGITICSGDDDDDDDEGDDDD